MSDKLPTAPSDQVEKERNVLVAGPEHELAEGMLDQVDQTNHIIAVERGMSNPPQHGQKRHQREDQIRALGGSRPDHAGQSHPRQTTHRLRPCTRHVDRTGLTPTEERAFAGLSLDRPCTGPGHWDFLCHAICRCPASFPPPTLIVPVVGRG